MCVYSLLPHIKYRRERLAGIPLDFHPADVEISLSGRGKGGELDKIDRFRLEITC